jgi:hypothetical protein
MKIKEVNQYLLNEIEQNIFIFDDNDFDYIIKSKIEMLGNSYYYVGYEITFRYEINEERQKLHNKLVKKFISYFDKLYIIDINSNKIEILEKKKLKIIDKKF